MNNPHECRIRIYILADGKPLEPLLDYPFSYFGTCPNVGDTLAFKYADERKLFSVSRRYHVYLRGWAIIVREVEESAQTKAVLKAWQEDDDWDAEIDAEEAMQSQTEYEDQRKLRQLLDGKPSPDIALDHREEPVIKKLFRRGVGVPFPCRSLRDFGEGTRKKLERRRFITVQAGKTGKFKDDEISLTPDGANAWKALMAFRKKVEAARAQR